MAYAVQATLSITPPIDNGEVRYIPKLYINSTLEWHPSKEDNIEKALSAFENVL